MEIKQQNVLMKSESNLQDPAEKFQELFAEIIDWDTFAKRTTFRHCRGGYLFRVAGHRTLVRGGEAYSRPWVFISVNDAREMADDAKTMADAQERAAMLLHSGTLVPGQPA